MPSTLTMCGVCIPPLLPLWWCLPAMFSVCHYLLTPLAGEAQSQRLLSATRGSNLFHSQHTTLPRPLFQVRLHGHECYVLPAVLVASVKGWWGMQLCEMQHMLHSILLALWHEPLSRLGAARQVTRRDYGARSASAQSLYDIRVIHWLQSIQPNRTHSLPAKLQRNADGWTWHRVGVRCPQWANIQPGSSWGWAWHMILHLTGCGLTFAMVVSACLVQPCTPPRTVLWWPQRSHCHT